MELQRKRSPPAREPVRDFSLDRGLITITLTAGARMMRWKGKIYEP